MSSTIFVNQNLEDILDLRRNTTGAHDPLVFFSFSRSFQFSMLPAGWTAASKEGAHASFYMKELEDRLTAGGLKNIVITNKVPTGA